MAINREVRELYEDETSSVRLEERKPARWLRSFPMRLTVLAAALLACGALMLFCDLSMSRWIATAPLPGFARKLIEMSEIFGHGLGVLAIILAAYHFDPRRRWALPRLVAVAYGGGLAANITKFLIVRVRPRGFDLALHDVWQTFLAWSPPWMRSSVNESFPSAHTATAAAFAVALTCLYPQARRFLFLLAAMVGVQRIVSQAHYPSDVCCGAAVGCLAAAALLSLPGSVAWLERLRQQDQSQPDRPAALEAVCRREPALSCDADSAAAA